MYHPLVIQRNLSIVEASGGPPSDQYPKGSPLSFPLQYYSKDYIRSCVSHLNSLINKDLWEDKGKLEYKRPLLPDEIQFIKNEQILSTFDYLYFARNYAFILHWNYKGLDLYEPSKAQLIINDVRAEMELKGVGIWIDQLKTRQIGASTDDQVAGAHRVLFHANTRGLTASSKEDKTRELADKCGIVIRNSPFYLLPTITRENQTTKKLETSADFTLYTSGEVFYTCESMNTKMRLQYGNQTGGVGRGETPTWFHGCFVSSTKVRLANGLVRDINKATVGNKSITSKGVLSKITDRNKSVWRTPDKTVDIKLWGNYDKLSTTTDHPILTPNGYSRADSLVKGGEVAISVRPITNTISTFTINHRRRGSSRYGVVHPQEINTYRQWGWFFGLYAAEGSLDFNPQTKDRQERPSRVIISIHEKEIELFKPMLDILFPGQVSIHRMKDPESKTVQLRIQSNGIAEFLYENFYNEDGKTIPDWAWSCGTDFCRGIVDGYIQGDGNVPINENRIVAPSIRLSITIQLRDLIASLGYGWSVISYKPAGDYYGRDCQECWRLSICGTTSIALRQDLGWSWIPTQREWLNHWRWNYDRTQIYIRIKEITEGYAEEFFYLTVEAEEHDFSTIHCCVKNTEIPDWDNPKEDLQNSLLKSMHNDPSFFFVLESTGKYKGDYFNELWDDATSYYFQGKSRFYPLFLGWYVADDIYPTKADVRAFMPLDYKPTERAERVAEQAERYVQTNDLLKKHMNSSGGEPWKMTLAQKWFYEWDRQQAERENRLATWLCEMPSTPEQAFAVRGNGMFDAEFIETLREKAKFPEFVFGISSSNYTINFKHRFDKSLIDLELEANSIPIQTRWSSNSNYNYSFLLTPLRPKNYTSKGLQGLLVVWELPDEDEEYEIALDGAEGIGQDYLSITVVAKGDYRASTKDRVVATFYSNQISTGESFPFLMALTGFYYYVRNNQVQQPKLIIERPRGGAALIMEVVKCGYKNFYVNRTLATRKLEDPSKKLGWDPNQQLRDDMLSEFLQAIKDDEVEVNCSFLIDCLATFGWNPTRRKMEALAGHHDDPIFSAGMAYYSINSFDLKGRDPGAERRRQEKRLRELNEKRKFIYEPGDMARPVPARKEFSYWDQFTKG